jgi:FtsZ-binding cell division protein ZapB
MILKLSKARYEGQPDEPLVPADCVAISLALPVNPEWVQNFLERFQSFKYKYGEVIDFERQHGLAAVEDYTETPASSVPSGMAAEEPDIPAVSPIQSEKQADPDAFVRSLIVVYESDSEVKIKVGAGKYTVYSCEDMGFKETAKPWVALITIIKDRAHLYNVGYKNSSTYEKNRGELRAISKKLVEFFNKTYKVQLPDNFMMFEPAKNEDAGMYGPKFSISIFGEDKDYASLPLGDLKTEIETLSEKNKQLSQYKDKSRRKTDDDEERQQLLKEQNIIEDKLNAAITVALEKKVITSDHVKDYYPKKSIGEENAETIEKDIFGDMQRKYHHAAAYSSLFGDRPSKEDD